MVLVLVLVAAALVRSSRGFNPARGRQALKLLQLNTTSWGPLMRSLPLLREYGVVCLQEQKARGARLDEMKVVVQRAGWKAAWAEALPGKGVAALAGVAVLFKPFLQARAPEVLVPGRLVAVQVQLRKIGWVCFYSAYLQPGRLWTEVNIEILEVLRLHTAGVGLWAVFADWNFCPSQLLAKVRGMSGWEAAVCSPVVTTCANLGDSSVLDFALVHPLLRNIMSEPDVQQHLPIKPHFAVAWEFARCLPGRHVEVLVRPPAGSPDPVFGPHWPDADRSGWADWHLKWDICFEGWDHRERGCCDGLLQGEAVTYQHLYDEWLEKAFIERGGAFWCAHSRWGSRQGVQGAVGTAYFAARTTG